jgi:hypothetical protein
MALRSRMMAALNFFLCGGRKRSFKILSGLGLFLLAIPQAKALTLAWDRNREPDIAGYKLYYGQTNSATTILNVGNSTNITVNNLGAGKTYYFYVTAYNTASLESSPSQRINYTVPQNADLTVRWDPSTSTNLSYYTFGWRELTATGPLTIVTNQSTSYRLPNLVAGKAYFLSVSAFNPNGSRVDLYAPIGPMLPAGQSTYWPPRVSGVYLSWDGSTGGNWVGKFGKVGRLVASEPNNTSPYFGSINGSYATWPQYSSTAAALQTSDGQSRIAANWYSTNEITVPIIFDDNQIHRLEAYFADYTQSGLQEYVDIVEPNGITFTSVSIANFQGGIYVIFDVKGRSTLRIRPRSGNYATLSGLFID